MAMSRVFTEFSAVVTVLAAAADQLNLLSPAAAGGLFVVIVTGFAGLMAKGLITKVDRVHETVTKMEGALGDGVATGLAYNARQAYELAHHANNRAQIAISSVEVLDARVGGLEDRERDRHIESE